MSVDDELAAALRLHQAGRLPEAERGYRRVLRMQPHHADAMHLWGTIALQQGNAREAVTRIEQALRIAGPNGDYLTNLGSALRKLGRHSEAEQAYRKALAVAPQNAAAALNLGMVLGDLGRRDEAIAALDRANSLRPNHAKTYLELGHALSAQQRFEDAIAAYRRAAELQPGWVDAQFSMAFVRELQGRTEDAAAAYETIVAEHADYLPALWYGSLLLPIVYRDTGEIETYRARWLRGLDRLEQWMDNHEAVDKRLAEETLLRSTNFYLHYQGDNPRAAQQRYGALLHRLARQVAPEFCRPLKPRRRGGRRLRIGFASAYLHSHSINKTHAQFALGLDRGRFEVSVFYLGKDQGETLTRLASGVEHFQSARDYRTAAQAIRQAELDALIYFDIGMDPMTQLLAALRLAPVQVNLGGHPVTSGLPTMDYFLSSALMEPPGAEAHYTERLVLLPNLATCYRMPDLSQARRPPGLAAAEPGQAAASVTYLNVQSLFKLLPGYDEVYPRIAARVPGARFWFIAANSESATEIFRARLERAFAGHGLDAARHCTIWPRLSQDEFYGLVQAADVVLDGWPWSGNNSTMEALACGRPVITLPGDQMRFRHSAAILTRIGLPELIAKDFDDLVAIATRAGTDSAWRGELTSVIARNKHRLFDDPAPIAALMDFLEALPVDYAFVVL